MRYINITDEHKSDGRFCDALFNTDAASHSIVVWVDKKYKMHLADHPGVMRTYSAGGTESIRVTVFVDKRYDLRKVETKIMTKVARAILESVERENE